ncbi:helix-turn-helix domain-containing protein [Flavobacterium cerinum]|uniref:ArsR family transcriptional regulator n=1 Tax=Flavobacterium cerinum TaxID=2502784 RepID=A0A3S3TSL1_9FLAO|nr:helix-turn-helix domain-containing protein [Flavobacterium cerinum]RWW91854.1 ArsR family transcriptional regulator [Flavobacterium cerinum]
MSVLSNEKKRAIAERLFVNDGMSCKEISTQIDISEQTLSKWRKGRTGEKDWDARRAEVISAPHVIKEILLKELKLVAEGEKPNVDADALAKISKVLETVSGKVSVQIILSVFKEFDNWMAEQDPKTAVLFTEYHKRFLIYRINQEG